MPGAYCKYCDRRCFVDRVMPDDATWRPGEHVHLATCVEGAAHDREQSGYDHTTAINPAMVSLTDPSGSQPSEPVYPAPGSAIPGQPGYVVGRCEHRVARSEWRSGFRTCERCPA